MSALPGRLRPALAAGAGAPPRSPRREPGSRPCARWAPAFAGIGGMLAVAMPIEAAPEIVDGGIPASLTGQPGDAGRGRAIVAERSRGLCLLCHAGPIPEERFQGDLAPDLAGAGRRWSPAQLRLRMTDARQLNPDTIMPSYRRRDGFARVGAAWRGRPILSDAEIEDVVAFLATLKEP